MSDPRLVDASCGPCWRSSAWRSRPAAATPRPAAAAPTAWAAWCTTAPTASACRPGNLYPREIARLIDHTLLKPEATREQIETLCREAREHGFATVCVNPAWVPLCAELLRGSETRVCTVVGFPLGATLPEVKAFEAARVVAEGACEVDMVMNIGALKSGDYRWWSATWPAWWRPATAGGACVKVIIETALLTDDEKVKACVIVAARPAPTSSRPPPASAPAAPPRRTWPSCAAWWAPTWA